MVFLLDLFVNPYRIYSYFFYFRLIPRLLPLLSISINLLLDPQWSLLKSLSTDTLPKAYQLCKDERQALVFTRKFTLLSPIFELLSRLILSKPQFDLEWNVFPIALESLSKFWLLLKSRDLTHPGFPFHVIERDIEPISLTRHYDRSKQLRTDKFVTSSFLLSSLLDLPFYLSLFQY